MKVGPRTLLALSSTGDWVSCNEEVANARAIQLNTKINPTSSTTLLPHDTCALIGPDHCWVAQEWLRDLFVFSTNLVDNRLCS